tara:strand:- start:20 stop:985 length:966 start_codon:yes stop_codon:yes gene_type:complete
MTAAATAATTALDPAKFRDPDVTAKGEARASVDLQRLETLWFNTGTLCNLTCADCYIESSPKNDRLTYISLAEVEAYLDEIETGGFGKIEIGLTGGEPFMNPDILPIIETCLTRGHNVIVLTNAMRPMMKCADGLLAINERFGDRLVLRVSVDHYTQALHEMERGKRSWKPTIDGLAWLAANGFSINVAGRMKWGEPEDKMRAGYARMCDEVGIDLDTDDPMALVLFPEMDADLDVPEITTACWDILGVSPGAMMCATSRMVVKRKGADAPAVVACTLLPYDPQFEMGETLEEASRGVKLNHPHCARFCVLGGGSCSVHSD